MSVIGIDFGNLSCYIAVERQGGIETIANDYSLRATPDPRIEEELKGSFSQQYGVSKKEDGSIGISVRYLGEEHIFTPAQITAMRLTKLKHTAEIAASIKVVDVVIGVPCYLDDLGRHAILEAALAAGLNVLYLLDESYETTAEALAYGIGLYKQDLPQPEKKPRNVIFDDCGRPNLQVLDFLKSAPDLMDLYLEEKRMSRILLTYANDIRLGNRSGNDELYLPELYLHETVPDFTYSTSSTVLLQSLKDTSNQNVKMIGSHPQSEDYAPVLPERSKREKDVPVERKKRTQCNSGFENSEDVLSYRGYADNRQAVPSYKKDDVYKKQGECRYIKDKEVCNPRYENHGNRDYSHGDNYRQYGKENKENRQYGKDYERNKADKRGICSDTRMRRKASDSGVRTRGNSLDPLKNEQSYSVHINGGACHRTGLTTVDKIKQRQCNPGFEKADYTQGVPSYKEDDVYKKQGERRYIKDKEVCNPRYENHGNRDYSQGDNYRQYGKDYRQPGKDYRQYDRDYRRNITDESSICSDTINQSTSNGQSIKYYRPNGGCGCIPPKAQSKDEVESYTSKNWLTWHWAKYMGAFQYVEACKERTPKIIYYSELAKCSLMQNNPDPDCRGEFYSNEKLLLTICGLEEVTLANGKKYQGVESPLLLGDRIVAQYLHLREIRNMLLRIEENLTSMEGGSDRPFFPVTLNKPPAAFGKRSLQKSSGKENVSPVSLPPSRVVQIGENEDPLASSISAKQHVSDHRKPLSVSNQKLNSRNGRQLVQTPLKTSSHPTKERYFSGNNHPQTGHGLIPTSPPEKSAEQASARLARKMLPY